MKRILAAVDGSEAALRALDFVAKLATETQAELVILTVAEELYVGDGALEQFARSEHLGSAWGDLCRARAKQILGTAEARVAPYKGLRWRVEWRMGYPAGEIIRFAKEQACDLIVVGHVGRSQLLGVLLGSVAFKLVTLALVFYFEVLERVVHLVNLLC
jgi:nucleotide-binding universal stress UspA family protein